MIWQTEIESADTGIEDARGHRHRKELGGFSSGFILNVPGQGTVGKIIFIVVDSGNYPAESPSYRIEEQPSPSFECPPAQNYTDCSFSANSILLDSNLSQVAIRNLLPSAPVAWQKDMQFWTGDMKQHQLTAGHAFVGLSGQSALGFEPSYDVYGDTNALSKSDPTGAIVDRAEQEIEAVELQSTLSDDSVERFVTHVEDVVQRYSNEGVAAAKRWVTKQHQPRDLCWAAIERLGQMEGPDTLASRKHLLVELLDSEHAGVRYSAVLALEFLMDKDVEEAVRQRLKKENNELVASAIRTRLR